MHWRSAIQHDLQTLVNKPRFGLVTDMDGTISPIVDNPDTAYITPRNRDLLRALVPHVTLLAVISGRAVTDVRERVGLPDLVYVGNHGFEWWTDDHVQLAPEAQVYRPALEAALQSIQSVQIDGMRIEDKGATLSVHYRQAHDPQAAEMELAAAIDEIARRQGLRVFKGRMVFELRPPVSLNKGSAFRELVERYHLDAALYLGDDTTDADALQMARQLRAEGVCDALGVAVLSADTPDIVHESADLSVSDILDVELLFAWLLDARKASSTWS